MNRDATTLARRPRLLLAAVLVIAVGLTTHLVGSGPVADRVGDALYTVMIYLVIAVAFPRSGIWIVGGAAAGICILIELFQLTGLPELWAESFWPVRLVLGVGFDSRDLVAYVVGACTAALLDRALNRRGPRT